ncbi:MAG: hypothetical protein ACYC7L_18905, partial [Nitrospirota bacterium]
SPLMGDTFLDLFAVLVASLAFGCCRFMVLSFYLSFFLLGLPRRMKLQLFHLAKSKLPLIILSLN